MAPLTGVSLLPISAGTEPAASLQHTTLLTGSLIARCRLMSVASSTQQTWPPGQHVSCFMTSDRKKAFLKDTFGGGGAEFPLSSKITLAGITGLRQPHQGIVKEKLPLSNVYNFRVV